MVKTKFFRHPGRKASHPQAAMKQASGSLCNSTYCSGDMEEYIQNSDGKKM